MVFTWDRPLCEIAGFAIPREWPMQQQPTNLTHILFVYNKLTLIQEKIQHQVQYVDGSVQYVKRLSAQLFNIPWTNYTIHRDRTPQKHCQYQMNTTHQQLSITFTSAGGLAHTMSCFGIAGAGVIWASVVMVAGSLVESGVAPRPLRVVGGWVDERAALWVHIAANPPVFIIWLSFISTLTISDVKFCLIVTFI